MRDDSRVREDMSMNFDPGFAIEATSMPLGFRYGEGAFGPSPEMRSLAAIRPALRDPNAPDQIPCTPS